MQLTLSNEMTNQLLPGPIRKYSDLSLIYLLGQGAGAGAHHLSHVPPLCRAVLSDLAGGHRAAGDADLLQLRGPGQRRPLLAGRAGAHPGLHRPQTLQPLAERQVRGAYFAAG